MNRNLLFPLVIGSVLIGIFVIVSSTILSVLLFIPGLVVSFLVYLNTFYQRTPDPEKLLPLYLLALGVQFVHFAEEYLTDFPEVLPQLVGQPAYPEDYWVVFNMIAYFVFILGGIIIFKQKRELMIVPLFFIVVGVIFNSIAHVLLALYAGGYFSGLYTSVIYLAIGPLLIRSIMAEAAN